jgi:hypothetical protein
MSYTKRAQANSVESDKGDAAHKLGTAGSKADVPTSPLVAQERKKSSTASGVRDQNALLGVKMLCRICIIIFRGLWFLPKNKQGMTGTK